MPDLTIPEWIQAKSSYHVIILLVLVAPRLTQWDIPSSGSDLWSPTFLSLGLTLLSLIASRNNISGPVRYGIYEYGQWMQNLYEKAPSGSVWALILLRFLFPWTQAWVSGVVSVGFQYIFQHFREDVRNVKDQANNLCARASIAVSTVEGHVTETMRYELDALSNGGNALRDARQVKGIKASDFFSACQTAWTAVESAANATNSAYSYSNTALSAAENARAGLNHLSSNYTTANTCYSQTSYAQNDLSKAQDKAEVARDNVTRFSAASNQDQEARRREQQNADRAVNGTRKIVEKTAGLSASLAQLSALAQEVRHTASLAVAAVEQGRMAQAKEHVEKAKSDLDKVDREAQRIASVKSDVRQLYVAQILG